MASVVLSSEEMKKEYESFGGGIVFESNHTFNEWLTVQEETVKYVIRGYDEKPYTRREKDFIWVDVDNHTHMVWRFIRGEYTIHMFMNKYIGRSMEISNPNMYLTSYTPPTGRVMIEFVKEVVLCGPTPTLQIMDESLE